MRIHQMPARAIRALTYLLELASRDAGYRVHGVRGWAMARDVEDAMGTRSASELMAMQAECGRAVRVDVRAPREAKPAWAYRVTQKGVDALAAAVGTSPADIDAPQGEKGPGVYIREGAWVALTTLRSVVETSPSWEKTWMVREKGWRSSREMTRLIENVDEAAGRRPGRSFLSEDTAWLAKMGFVERRVVAKNHIYRVTEAGMKVERLEWKEPPSA